MENPKILKKYGGTPNKNVKISGEPLTLTQQKWEFVGGNENCLYAENNIPIGNQKCTNKTGGSDTALVPKNTNISDNQTIIDNSIPRHHILYQFFLTF